MAVLTVDDLEVHFPFVPYDVQKELMRKVIHCLKEKENGLLESPTGTGKTLSLLCAAVAWQKKQKELVRKSFNNPGAGGSGGGQFLMSNSSNSKPPSLMDITDPNRNANSVPKIIYSSRTHAQLSQAVQELKRSFYNNTKTVVLGSRDVMCVHEEVSRMENASAKIMACHLRVHARSCGYYNNVAKKKDEMNIREKPIVDIEDIVVQGKKNRFCPFFMSREFTKDAEVVFMPYNYLLDPKLRSSHGIDLNNCVIILDEGHNIAKMCEESVSFEIKSSTIAQCIQEVTRAMNEFNEISQQSSSTNNALIKDLTLGSLISLKQSLLQLEQELDTYVTEPSGKLLPGQTVLTSIFQNGFPPSMLPKVVNDLDLISSFLSMNSFDATGCDKFSSVLRVLSSRTMFRNPLLFADSYKVFLKAEEKKGASLGSLMKSGPQPKVFNFWCFNPTIGLEMVMQYGPRCIILASGTLSPLSFLESELQIPFPVKLSNPHIIGDNQLYACILKKGPGPQFAKLSSSFQNRKEPDYLNGLGEVIKTTCSIVPKGVLVFFPSYTVMDVCFQSWQATGMLDKISAYKKVLMEPRGKDAFRQVMENYYSAVKNGNGACLLAVCRGKVSEGLDFSDDNGRAVIITGIPYSPYLDPHVVAKKAYLDHKKNEIGKINGRTWYQLEAVRALNQAVGRIIRHAQDYGAVLLCDERCDTPDVLKNLSPWLEKRLKRTSDFSEIIRGLSQFFKIPSKTGGGMYSQGRTTGFSSVGSIRSKQSSKSSDQSDTQSFIQDVDMDKDLSSLYSETQQISKVNESNDGLFASLGTVGQIKPAANFHTSKLAPTGSLNRCSKEHTGSITDPKLKSRRKRIRVESTMMDYENCDHSERKKGKDIFSAEPDSDSQQNTLMETDPPYLPSPTFSSLKEFFEWVRQYLTNSEYAMFLNSVKVYKTDKDIERFGEQVLSLFKGHQLSSCLEGLKLVLPLNQVDVLIKNLLVS